MSTSKQTKTIALASIAIGAVNAVSMAMNFGGKTSVFFGAINLFIAVGLVWYGVYLLISNKKEQSETVERQKETVKQNQIQFIDSAAKNTGNPEWMDEIDDFCSGKKFKTSVPSNHKEEVKNNITEEKKDMNISDIKDAVSDAKNTATKESSNIVVEGAKAKQTVASASESVKESVDAVKDTATDIAKEPSIKGRVSVVKEDSKSIIDKADKAIEDTKELDKVFDKVKKESEDIKSVVSQAKKS